MFTQNHSSRLSSQHSLAFGIAIGLFLVTVAPAHDDEAASDLKWLQGEWILIAERSPDGKPVSDNQIKTKDKRLSIRGDQATFSERVQDGKVLYTYGEIELDASASPKQLKCGFEGIYVIDKDLDTFTLCTVPAGPRAKRPMSFTDAGSRLEKYKRDTSISTALKTGDLKKVVAYLSAADPRSRKAALQALGDLGPVAKGQSSAVEKCIFDEEFQVQIAAVRALIAVTGAPEAATLFTKLSQSGVNPQQVRRAALVGLEDCGPLGMGAVEQTINDADIRVRENAIHTAAIIDVQGSLYNRILPMLASEPESVLVRVRRYILVHGIRRFYREQGRWPTSFAEAHDFIRKGNPLINLSAMIKFGDVPIRPQPNGSFKLGGPMVFKVVEDSEK